MRPAVHVHVDDAGCGVRADPRLLTSPTDVSSREDGEGRLMIVIPEVGVGRYVPV